DRRLRGDEARKDLLERRRRDGDVDGEAALGRIEAAREILDLAGERALGEVQIRRPQAGALAALGHLEAPGDVAAGERAGVALERAVELEPLTVGRVADGADRFGLPFGRGVDADRAAELLLLRPDDRLDLALLDVARQRPDGERRVHLGGERAVER